MAHYPGDMPTNIQDEGDTIAVCTGSCTTGPAYENGPHRPEYELPGTTTSNVSGQSKRIPGSEPLSPPLKRSKILPAESMENQTPDVDYQ